VIGATVPGGGTGRNGMALSKPYRYRGRPADPAAKLRAPPQAECEPHTPQPASYLAWHAWAEKMAETHNPRRCKGCGLWQIWEPKPEEPEPEPPQDEWCGRCGYRYGSPGHRLECGDGEAT
jgi:hypothetical protein